MKKFTYYNFGQKKNYLDFIYLAEFYLWSYKHSNNATESRSPIDGKRFQNNSNHAHHLAHKEANLAMAKSYLHSAIELRKATKLNLFTPSGGYYWEEV